jgi:hypothetical protein
MKYKNIQKLSDAEFRRATGVKRGTFELMIEILKEKEALKKKVGGRPNKLPTEERLIMTLEYLREYRTFFHIAKDYGISEPLCHINIKKIENTLIKSGEFNLPKRKEKLMSEDEMEAFVLDATETPIERPKKN